MIASFSTKASIVLSLISINFFSNPNFSFLSLYITFKSSSLKELFFIGDSNYYFNEKHDYVDAL